MKLIYITFSVEAFRCRAAPAHPTLLTTARLRKKRNIQNLDVPTSHMRAHEEPLPSQKCILEKTELHADNLPIPYKLAKVESSPIKAIPSSPRTRQKFTTPELISLATPAHTQSSSTLLPRRYSTTPSAHCSTSNAIKRPQFQQKPSQNSPKKLLTKLNSTFHNKPKSALSISTNTARKSLHKLKTSNERSFSRRSAIFPASKPSPPLPPPPGSTPRKKLALPGPRAALSPHVQSWSRLRFTTLTQASTLPSSPVPPSQCALCLTRRSFPGIAAEEAAKMHATLF